MTLSGIPTGPVTQAYANTTKAATQTIPFPQTPIGPNGVDSKGLQPDKVEISAAAKAKAAAGRTVLSATRGPAPLAPGAAQKSPESPVSPQAAPTYSRADITQLFDLWGEQGAGSSYDFNEDGQINSADLAELVTRLGQPKPDAKLAEGGSSFTQADIGRLRESWNNGSDPNRAVEARYDLDGDGRVNASDLAALLARLAGAPS